MYREKTSFLVLKVCVHLYRKSKWLTHSLRRKWNQCYDSQWYLVWGWTFKRQEDINKQMNLDHLVPSYCKCWKMQDKAGVKGIHSYIWGGLPWYIFSSWQAAHHKNYALSCSQLGMRSMANECKECLSTRRVRRWSIYETTFWAGTPC